jgi:hypothetical protein
MKPILILSLLMFLCVNESCAVVSIPAAKAADNPSDTLSWAFTFGGSGEDSIDALALDQNSHYYVAGKFTGHVNMDPFGTGEFMLSTSNDGEFLGCYDTGSHMVWMVSWPHRIGNITTEDLAADSDGNVYMTGTFDLNIDLDPGPGVYVPSIKDTGSACGTGGCGLPPRASFLAKFDSSGRLSWAVDWSPVNPVALELGKDGSVYVAGTFDSKSPADFDPGQGSCIEAKGTDIFVSKYDSLGNYLWTWTFGGPNMDDLHDMVIDDSGNLYLAGDFANKFSYEYYGVPAKDQLPHNYSIFYSVPSRIQIQVNPDQTGNNSSYLVSNGGQDAFLLQLDSDGKLGWVKGWGKSGNDSALKVKYFDGRLYVAGSSEGAVSLDQGSGQNLPGAEGESSNFLSVYSTDGNCTKTEVDVLPENEKWSRQLVDMGLDGSGNLYIARYINNMSAAAYVTIAKTASDGTHLWSRDFGIKTDDDVTMGNVFAVDKSGGLYLGGKFRGNFNVGGDDREAPCATAGHSKYGFDGFMMRIGSDGSYKPDYSYCGREYYDTVAQAIEGPWMVPTNYTPPKDNRTEWAKSWGSPAKDGANAVAVDPSGNVFVGGSTESPDDPELHVKGDPGSARNRNPLLSKFDSHGNLIWRINAMPDRGGGIEAICFDRDGNIYITGAYDGAGLVVSADGAPVGDGTQVYTVIVEKVDQQGNVTGRWLMLSDQTESAMRVQGSDICVDRDGNIYLAGSFRGNTDFDPGPNEEMHKSSGQLDVFLAKYDSGMKPLWVHTWGSGATGLGKSVRVGENGKVYVCGFFYGCMDLDPTDAVKMVTAPYGGGGFLIRLDADGNCEWSGSWPNWDLPSMTLDNSGNVLITGMLYMEGDIDPTDGVDIRDTKGYADMDLIKLDPDCKYLWGRTWGSVSMDRGYSVAADPQGNIYVVGAANEGNDSDAPRIVDYPDSGFLAEYGPDGTHLRDYLWKNRDPEYQMSSWRFGVAVDGTGAAYVAGTFAQPSDFEPGPGKMELTPNDQDAYLVKFIGE